MGGKRERERERERGGGGQPFTSSPHVGLLTGQSRSALNISQDLDGPHKDSANKLCDPHISVEVYLKPETEGAHVRSTATSLSR